MPVPRREVAVLPRHAEPRVLPLLRLPGGWRRHQLPDADGRARFHRGRRAAGGEVRRPAAPRGGRRPARGPSPGAAAQQADRGQPGRPGVLRRPAPGPGGAAGAPVPHRAGLRRHRRRDVRQRLRPARRRGTAQGAAREGLPRRGERRGRAGRDRADRRTTGSAGACSGRSATPPATRSASGRGGSTTTTRSRPSTSTPPRPRSTRRARSSTASTWRGGRWAAARRRSWSRATPT